MAASDGLEFGCPLHIRLCYSIVGTDASQIEPLQRLAIAIALSEITARDSGVKKTRTFIRNINKFLQDALSKP